MKRLINHKLVIPLFANHKYTIQAYTIYKLAILILIICFLVKTFAKPALLLYYYSSNGHMVEFGDYIIDVPYPQWIIRSIDDSVYRLIHTVDGKVENLYIDLSIDEYDDQYDKDYTLQICYSYREFHKSYAEVEGTEYLCPNNRGSYLYYFLSDDKKFYLLKYPYYLTEENQKSYDLLLNSVKRK
jgi:hypothetical protein